MQGASKTLEQCLRGARLPQGALVDGAWHPVTGPRRDVVDPATGTVLVTTADAEPDVVGSAVDAARRAFAGWSEIDASARGEVCERVADVVERSSEVLARLETLDTGKPLAQSAADVRSAVQYFRYYAHATAQLFGATIPTTPDRVVATTREPYGVVAHITPWNAPLSQLSRGVAPCVAAGNTVVVKPSELAPLSSVLFAELVRGVLPPGVLNLVVGDGAVTGQALASHPGIDHLTFTGSVATGVRVSRAAAANVVATNLELGGKSAALVFADADLDAAVSTAVTAVVRNSGQSCSALSRFVVHQDVVEAFTERLVARVRGLSVGPGVDGHDVGPLISPEQRDRVVGLVHDAVEQGAVLAAGTARPPEDERLAGGFFLEPMVLTGVQPESGVARTEVFGPVQSVLTFTTADEAVEIANGTDYGLVAAVFTRDITVATRCARRLRAGQVQINGFAGAGVEMPFGGYKHSGHGREKGFEALLGYTQVKTTVTHLPSS